MVCSDRTRGNSFKLEEGRFGLYMIMIYFFLVRVMRYRNTLPRVVVDTSSQKVFKVRLNRALSRRCPACEKGVRTDDPSRSIQPIYASMIL